MVEWKYHIMQKVKPRETLSWGFIKIGGNGGERR